MGAVTGALSVDRAGRRTLLLAGGVLAAAAAAARGGALLLADAHSPAVVQPVRAHVACFVLAWRMPDFIVHSFSHSRRM
jgi:hypothetical protein